MYTMSIILINLTDLLRKRGEHIGHHNLPRVQHWCNWRRLEVSSGKENKRISGDNFDVKVFNSLNHLPHFGMFQVGTNILC
jgi:hypothetical protein